MLFALSFQILYNTVTNQEGGLFMISKDMSIVDLLNDYPVAMSVLQKHGVGCMGCIMANAETVEQGLGAHGLDVDAVLADIEAQSANAQAS